MGFNRSSTTVDDVRAQLGKLSEGLSELVDQVSDLVASTSDSAVGEVKSRASRVRDNLDDVVALAGDRGRQAQAAVSDAARSAAGTVEETFHARPWLTLVVAIGLGYLLASARRR
jgi:ElaB/YqjD/DUF883 family membrane-anchored ribosome-binding protein